MEKGLVGWEACLGCVEGEKVGLGQRSRAEIINSYPSSYREFRAMPRAAEGGRGRQRAAEGDRGRQRATEGGI